MVDWPTLLSFVGGGIGVKALDLLAFRDRSTAAKEARFDAEASVMRAELWKEIGALREICNQQTSKIDRMEQHIHELHANRHGWRSRAIVLKSMTLDLMEDINDLSVSCGKPTKYNITEQQRILDEAEKELDSIDASAPSERVLSAK